MSDPRRDLPAVHALIALIPDIPHAVARDAARRLLDLARVGAPPKDWTTALREEVIRVETPHLRRVINATGVVLHTNLGRAPLSDRAAAAVTAIAGGYSNLELDLETGERGERLQGVAPRLKQLFGVEAALAVNNCAASVLLALSALAAGKEVIVSRGELVEIGGSFRIPEVITACGAHLREVGTTNRTRLRDYEAAITPDTAVILRVHPSNFHVEGFTERADRAELVALAHQRGLLYVEDLGGGAMIDRGPDEPSIPTVCAAGPDVICFSGDKLFGGPQAGIAIGKAAPIRRMRSHPLYRALRLDRLVLGALEATLIDRVAGAEPPVDRMLGTPLPVLKTRADRLAQAIGAGAERVPTFSLPGGGTLPALRLESAGVRLPCPHADAVARALRLGDPAVIARVEDGAVVLDVRCVLDGEIEAVARAVRTAVFLPVSG